jgi:hypothetical protein
MRYRSSRATELQSTRGSERESERAFPPCKIRVHRTCAVPARSLATCAVRILQGGQARSLARSLAHPALPKGCRALPVASVSLSDTSYVHCSVYLAGGHRKRFLWPLAHSSPPSHTSYVYSLETLARSPGREKGRQAFTIIMSICLASANGIPSSPHQRFPVRYAIYTYTVSSGTITAV